MSVKKYSSGAWGDISSLNRYANGAWTSCNAASKYVNGAWQEVWSATGYTFTKFLNGGSGSYTATATANGDSASFKLYCSTMDGSSEGYAAIMIYCPEAAFVVGDTVSWSCTVTITSIKNSINSYDTFYAHASVVDPNTNDRANLETVQAYQVSRNFTANYARTEPWLQIDLTSMYGTTIEGTISNVRINGKKCVFDF